MNMLDSDFSANLVYSTANTAILQCDRSDKFEIRLFDQEITLSVCALIAFKKKIKDVDLAAMFDTDHAGIEVISLPYCDRIFVFTIQEILELKDLFSGSFAMLELNSLIHKAIIRR
ncbi:MAG: hypothetical protein ABJ004_08245 [Cyclobacteriaceae bacterium]